MTRAMRRMRKYLLIVACIALVLGVAIGGTIAWLADTSDTVTNTFTTTDIEVGLTETTGAEYVFIPNVNITKNPTVTAECDVECYVFVEVVPTGWALDDEDEDKRTFELYDGDVSCTIDSSWTYVQDYVYYQTVPAGTEFSGSVLQGNTITVSSGLSENDMHDANGNAIPSKIELAFTAYAIQKTGFDGSVEAAFAAAKSNAD